jgi:hypothetical protein
MPFVVDASIAGAQLLPDELNLVAEAYYNNGERRQGRAARLIVYSPSFSQDATHRHDPAAPVHATSPFPETPSRRPTNAPLQLLQ